MSKITAAGNNFGRLERLASLNTPVHRIDPVAKVLVTLVFIFVVVSFDRYEISGLLVFFIYPALIAVFAEIPFGYIGKTLIYVSPFAVMVGIFNPVFDRHIAMTIGTVGISGGWISFMSIIVRFVLTVSAALLLIATTGFYGICSALERLKVPQVFVVQLMFLYRYIFVLIEETSNMTQARALRSFNGRGMGIKTAGSMMGHLLIRTIQRSRRVHQSMVCRGFDGAIRTMKEERTAFTDIIFGICCCLFFVIAGIYNIPVAMGDLIRGIL